MHLNVTQCKNTSLYPTIACLGFLFQLHLNPLITWHVPFCKMMGPKRYKRYLGCSQHIWWTYTDSTCNTVVVIALTTWKCHSSSVLQHYACGFLLKLIYTTFSFLTQSLLSKREGFVVFIKGRQLGEELTWCSDLKYTFTVLEIRGKACIFLYLFQIVIVSIDFSSISLKFCCFLFYYRCVDKYPFWAITH